ncbi:uncharacterized protein Z520_07955 [Fonsecaea multimorphosa CBS 102226]|uniref:Uncharacterized protein n=1 Tax=Fonsecaea multimorphosa CBS 102226 TaxID=1442371 RepID=A0A0D2JRU7_9EURO|nr:uncharacterized protein Z520_07955 [Fonsecaea multimorphosa CBS 102226]KIX96177.1 hypothetical protein Z520_07955 [Fonsecaea multimorphosa CBS 102226]
MGWGLKMMRKGAQIAVQNPGIGDTNKGAWRPRENKNYLVQVRTKLYGIDGNVLRWSSWVHMWATASIAREQERGTKVWDRDQGKNGQTKVVENIQYGIEQDQDQDQDRAPQACDTTPAHTF